MTDATLNMKVLNRALTDLHNQAQEASASELETIANRYIVLVAAKGFREYLSRLFRNESRNLADEDVEDCFQEVCLRISNHIKAGKLPVAYSSGSGYFITAFKHYLISFVKKKVRLGNVSLQDSNVQLADEKIVSGISNRQLYNLENLKFCFFSLFFLLDKTDLTGFKYYCARIGYSKDEICAQAVTGTDEHAWSEMEKSAKREKIKEFKNKIKSLDYKASNLFNTQVRQIGFYYQNRDFSERASKELTNTSGIIKGILWHFYINEDAIVENLTITKGHQQGLIKKMKIDNSLLSIDGKSPANGYFDFEKFLYATLTVFQQLDDAGKGIYYQQLLQELVKEEVQNQEFLDLFTNSLVCTLKRDKSE